MTRANLTIISDANPPKAHFQINGDGGPGIVTPVLMGALNSLDGYKELSAQALTGLVDELGLTLGYVLNVCYYYELDCTKGRLRVWESKTYWQTVPDDWEAKGYQGISKNSEGRWGYASWRKGKLISTRYSGSRT